MHEDASVYPLHVCDLEELGNQAWDLPRSAAGLFPSVQDGTLEGEHCMWNHPHDISVPPYDVL